MAKAIKRVGIIFLALAIICLLAVGVMIGQNKANSVLNNSESSLNSANQIENINATNEEELPPIVEEIFLDGATCEAQAAKWTEAIEKSLANGGNNHILVTMKTDWIAPNSGNHDFGTTENSFTYGRLNVPENSIITLDLNGKTISRSVTTLQTGGLNVIVVKGTMILKDSGYNSNAVQSAYNANPANVDLVSVAKNNGAGCITGGWSDSTGGGIIVSGSAKLFMYSGVICENRGEMSGGGIYGTMQSNIYIYDGIIANNKSSHGGGFYITNECTFNFYNGFIFNNSALTHHGAGISLISQKSHSIKGGVIAKNTALDDGGGIFLANSTLNITGGIIERNVASGTATSCGGAICGINSSKLNISGATITNNESGYYGGAIYSGGTSAITTISDTRITNNMTRKHEGVTTATAYGGMIVDNCLRLGAGCFIYNNTADGRSSNVHSLTHKIEIFENLVANGKAFRVAVTCNNSFGTFTSGLNNHKAPMTANQLFLADNGMAIKEDSNGEAVVGTAADTAQAIYWRYAGSNNQPINTEGHYARLPYTGQTYTISAVVASTNASVPIQQLGGTGLLTIKDPGRYCFYTTGNYKSASFQIEILEPKSKIDKPTQLTDNVFIFGGVQQEFVPQGFDSNTMEIAYNRATNAGEYTASVKLKDAWNTTWSDGSTGTLTYTYKIIRDSVIGASSDYDYIYKDINNLRQNYTDNSIYHKYNDNVLNVVDGNPRYIIGNITANTSVSQFITNLKSEDITKVKLFNDKGNVVYNGTTQSSSYDIDKILVQTGWYLEYSNYYGNTETIYLSVLGDVVADGVINTLDVTFINRIARGNVDFESLSLERQLAAMVDNKGKVTSTDGKILLNVIGGNLVSQDYFENNVNMSDIYQLWDLKDEDGKLFRDSIDLTTAGLVDNAIIGNISPETKAVDFKTKLANQLGIDISAISVYKSNGAVANDNEIIGTGYYINYNGNTGNKIYLSVLGDLTGDGRVNTTDVTYLNRLVNGSITLDISNIKDKLTMLAATIQNKGKLTTADSESLLNYIGNNVDIKQYF